MRHLGPLIEERLEQETRHGKDRSDKPNDLIDWLLEVAQGPQRTVRNISIRVLVLNFAAIHTTSGALTNVLYDLAIHPEYVQPLREEIESVRQEEGWSKATVGKLRKLDSFIKESLRLSSHSFVMVRKVVRDFTFSDGTVVPAGNMLAVPLYAIHRDAENYRDPGTFDGFRFANMREQEGEGVKHQMVSLDLDYLLFGHGCHACPGRFFAVTELKVMLAHILLNYDVKMADDGVRPATKWFGSSAMPDPCAEVLFRKRV
ncbi:hypothetical protein AX17_001225 [Amanita inopinata Kibby_2008]|nr:hypothetical protein AX17_001225 [Amanita inopinata Kibby_2008]